LKIKRFYFEIKEENKIECCYFSTNSYSSYSSVYLISNTKELLKCFSNFTKEELEEMGVHMTVSEDSIFVEEQKVVIPMIHKTGKYKIDGYNYYGVFNDSYGCYISNDGKFSFKLTRHGSSGTYFIRIRKIGHGKNAYDVLEALYFGNSDPCTFIAPYFPISKIFVGSIFPYATTHSTSGFNDFISL